MFTVYDYVLHLYIVMHLFYGRSGRARDLTVVLTLAYFFSDSLEKLETDYGFSAG